MRFEVSFTDLGELQVVAPAAVPVDRRRGPRQVVGLRPVVPERAVLVDLDRRRVGSRTASCTQPLRHSWPMPGCGP